MTSPPSLPNELLEAQEDGLLVCFCGAGLSKLVGLPLFNELVDRIYNDLGEIRSDVEEAAYIRKDYDRTLYFLEDRIGSDRVRGVVERQLRVKVPDVNPHKAVINISTGPSGFTHLVTTNFDELFSQAALELGVRLQFDCAPYLPVPKRQLWNSAVHLHGGLHQSGSRWSRLVLNTADFGAAYLTERWASLFVSELFRRYVVLFIGYGANDGVMRYILDAVAADRRKAEEVKEPWAFADFRPSDGPNVAIQEWKAKGVRAIPYEASGGDHSALSRCLENWALDWRDGLISKSQVVRSFVSSDPASLRSDELQRVSWALRDYSGTPARMLLDESTTPPSPVASRAWLEHFASEGLLEIGQKESQAPPSLIMGTGSKVFQAPPWSKRPEMMSRWLLSLADDREFYWWYVRNGASMLPWAAEYFSRGAYESGISDVQLITAWQAITSGAINVSQISRQYSRELPTRIRAGKWSRIIKYELIEALTPRMVFRGASGPAVEIIIFRGNKIEYKRPLIDPELTLGCDGNGFTSLIEDALIARKRDKYVWSDLSVAANTLLLRAVDLWAIASETWNGVRPEPSVGTITGLIGDGGRRMHPWTLLIDLAWECFAALDRRGSISARRQFLAWADHSSPVVRQLAIKAASEGACLTSAERLRVLK